MHKEDLKQAMLDYIETYFSDDIATKKAMQIADEALIEHYIQKEIPQEGRAIFDVVKELEEDIFPNALQSRHPKHFA
ncbi:MAG TPA: hypothetical protein VIG45_07435, partial [Erysipelothrix sp.]